MILNVPPVKDKEAKKVSMSNFRMKTLVLGMIRTNCYIISNGDTREAIVIDPAAEADVIEQYLKANDLVCKAILLTHGHFDHILAVEELSQAVHATIYAGEAEAALLKDPLLNSSRNMYQDVSLSADVWLKDQQQLELAGFSIKVIHTPGHTVGGVCYYFEGQGILLSGDTLFYESIGRADLPTGDASALVDAILSKLMRLEDSVKVYPGHGQSTTIGHERKNNVYLSGDLFY